MQMNKTILCAMDMENRTKAELDDNRRVAVAAAYAAAAYAAYDADAAYAAYAAEYWINEYFELTGENREDYEKELEKCR